MNIWHNISPKRISAEDFVAVIEIPKGSKIKYELDKETGLIKLDRILYTLFLLIGLQLLMQFYKQKKLFLKQDVPI